MRYKIIKFLSVIFFLLAIFIIVSFTLDGRLIFVIVFMLGCSLVAGVDYWDKNRFEDKR